MSAKRNELLACLGIAIARLQKSACRENVGRFVGDNAPGHGHGAPPIWDPDNRPGVGGEVCAWCAEDWPRILRAAGFALRERTEQEMQEACGLALYYGQEYEARQDYARECRRADEAARQVKLAARRAMRAAR